MKAGIIALSSGLGGLFPHIRDLGVYNLKEFYNIDSKVYKSATMFPDEVRKNPKLRADELNQALNDPEIHYIHALIGGDDSVRINDHIAITEANKPIVGFSDATCYLSYLAQHNKPVIYGPSILAGMAQAKYLGEEFIKNFKDVVLEKETVIYPKYDFYVEGYHEWADKENNGRILEKKSTKGPFALQGSGKVRGELWGGCINSLEQLKSTKYYPSEEYLRDKIIFFDFSEERYTPEQFRRILYNYAMQGIFERNNAIMFSIIKGYSEEEVMTAHRYIREVLVEEYKYSIPIMVDCPIGHTAPMWFLPYNETFEIDFDKVEFRVLR